MAENGKYKIALVVFGSIFVVILSFMGSGVIANDRIRASEDLRICDKMSVLKDSMYEELKLINIKLAKIEQILVGFDIKKYGKNIGNINGSQR